MEKNMSTKNETTNKNWLTTALICLLVACLACAGGYYFAKQKGDKESDVLKTQLEEFKKERSELQELNRASVSGMKAEGTIYVIGHKSPDSDTVCTAIAYANLLNQLGYQAEPRITMKVNHESEYILSHAGVKMPEILYDASGENIFLVDHAEYAQAADGMQDAHIVGIIDHHGVGSVLTGHQVVYEAKPIGATATIVWLDYLNYGIEIDQQMAYVLLSAILSDTYNLNNSSTTDADRKAVELLAPLAGVEDVEDHYKHLREQQLNYEGMSTEEIILADYKEYEVEGTKFGIGLAGAIDEESAEKMAAQIKEAIVETAAKKDTDLFYCEVSMYEDGKKYDYVIPADEKSASVLKNACESYGYEEHEDYIFFKTGLGRKSKFVPGLTNYLGSYPHE